MELYFGDTASTLTTVLALALIVFMVLAIRKGRQITKWGRLIALFILVGTGISAFSAMRDAYATPTALFAMDSIQLTIGSISGGAIFLAGIASMFLKSQSTKKYFFYTIKALFAVNLAVIEGSRLAAALGGRI